MDPVTRVELFTDGACSGNPGPGGYGAILRYTDPKGEVFEREYSEGFPETTNNRMEILAVAVGLEHLLRPCTVTVYSDSQYLVNAMTLGWLDGWQKEDFRRGRRNEVKNIDLWERLLRAQKDHKVEYIWVKGHAGHPENERCDRLAVSAYKNLDRSEAENSEAEE